LTLWVLICIVIGSLIGYYAPAVSNGLNSASVAQVNIPIALLIWILILPAMIQVDFRSLKDIKKQPKPLIITVIVNYAVQPFTMFGFAVLFFRMVFAAYISPAEQQDQFIAGAVFLGAGPCTAMVFLWSLLCGGDASYTLVQVALNDVLLCILYAPTVGGLIGVANLQPPWLTIILSIVFYLIAPVFIAIFLRMLILRRWGASGIDWLVARSTTLIEATLLIMLILVFICQGPQIPGNITKILMIIVPLLLQTFVVFGIGTTLMFWAKVEYKYAAPGILIGTSNFFELAVALSITVYGPQSGAALVSVVGVLTEVPIMLFLVWICKKLKPSFVRRAASTMKQREHPTVQPKLEKHGSTALNKMTSLRSCCVV